MSEEVKNQTEGKELAYSEEELAGLLAQNQKLQEKENAGESVKADYLILAKTGTKALQRSKKEYIQGLQIGDIFLQKEKNSLIAKRNWLDFWLRTRSFRKKKTKVKE